MSRNSSGTYSLPETPFTPGTTIQSSPVNSNFSDIADALTGSLALSGVSTMSGPIKAANGSVSAPSITFGNATGTGFYLSDTNEISYTANGTLAITFAATGLVSFVNGIEVGNQENAGTDVLDWYEEGTFTPALEFGGATTGITYTSRSGKYTRIGNVVLFDLTIDVNNNGTASGDATISGLPYTNNATNVAVCQVANMVDWDTSETAQYIFGTINTSASEITLWARYTSENDAQNVVEGDIINGTKLHVTGHYRV